MPHVSIKMYPGRSEEQKARLAEELTKVFIKVNGNTEASVSVSIEDVEPSDWPSKVYESEIIANWDKLYKKPGYDPR